MKPSNIVASLPGGAYLDAAGSHWRFLGGRWVRVSATETAFQLAPVGGAQ